MQPGLEERDATGRRGGLHADNTPNGRWVGFQSALKVAMFFRFFCALSLVLLVSLIGTMFEKRNLELNRVVSRQHYQLEILSRQHAQERMLAQQLGGPARLVKQLDKALEEPAPSAKPAHALPKAP
jgi:hypothetical protein